MGEDDEGTLASLKAVRNDLVDPQISLYRGRIVKTTGDGLLAEFGSVVDAVRCATEIQRGMSERKDDTRIEFRIGVNVGDVIIEDGDIFGDGVNIAARLEGIASPGTFCVSSRVHEDVQGKLDVAFEDLGEQRLKNINRPIHVFQAKLGIVSTAITRPVLPDKPSIAVLPFDNIGGDVEQSYVADGIVESITAALSRIRAFFVIARNSAFTFKGRAANVRDVGKQLGVAYVLEGSVQKSGNRIRVTAQLIETEAASHVWAGQYDGKLDDFFDLQDRITEQVAGALSPSIRIAEIERSRRKRPQELGAYDYTMRAMPHVWALEKGESDKALQLLDKALSLDDGYALALSLAAWCHAQRSVYDWVDNIRQSQARALAMAERAAEISADDPLVLAVLGAVNTFLRNLGSARVLLERAVSIDVNSAWAWSRLGWLDTYSDRPIEAIEKFERSMRLSPLDPMNFNNFVGIGSAKEVAEDYNGACTFYRRALEERPHATWIYRNLTSSLSGAGRLAEARVVCNQLMQNYPNLTIARVREAMVFSSTFLDRMGANLRRMNVPD